jgi:hypothetical protein
MANAKDILKRLPEGWPQSFLERYDSGASDWELMKEFAIRPREWHVLITSLGDSEFAEIVEFGHALARAWWEAQGRLHLDDKSFNTQLYNINMANRWGWQSKADSNEASSPVEQATPQQLKDRLTQLLNQLDEKDQVSEDVVES